MVGHLRGSKSLPCRPPVNVDPTNYPPSAWISKEGWKQPTVADDKDFSIAKAFGVTSFPFFVVTKGDGTVTHRQAGELAVDELTAAAQKAF